MHFPFLLAFSLFATRSVDGHGRLMEPPSRNSMWRVGFSNPPNYGDNELNCGGFAFQWMSNGGKCGVCGDPYGRKQEHVYPGKFANNIITRTYNKGQSIQVKVQITANHKGYFTFKIGDIGNPPITEKKLDHILKIGGTDSTRYHLPKGSGAGYFVVSLHLPQTLTCKHCVLQWTYTAGNSWGTDATGNGVGKGAQETFVNCADVSIKGDGGPQTTMMVISTKTSATSSKPRTVTKISTLPARTTTLIPTTPKKVITEFQTTKITTAPTRKTQKPTSPPAKQKCKGAASYAKVPGMDSWCNANCPRFCPKSHCTCSSQPVKLKCRGAGSYEAVAGMDAWCNLNCPTFCPKSHCICI